MTTRPDPDPYRYKRYLRTTEVRAYLGGISKHKLARMRAQRAFPEPIDLGGLHVYAKHEIDDWLDAQRANGGADHG